MLELVDGWDLNQLVGQSNLVGFTIPPEIALFIAAEICRGLGHAHEKKRGGVRMNIVHRDVSPHNILVSREGEIKITDFGIAKALINSERTGEGVIKGKLAFMSPEQAMGRSVDARSDLLPWARFCT